MGGKLTKISGKCWKNVCCRPIHEIVCSYLNLEIIQQSIPPFSFRKIKGGYFFIFFDYLGIGGIEGIKAKVVGSKI
jgi:hypothetical protein